MYITEYIVYILTKSKRLKSDSTRNSHQGAQKWDWRSPEQVDRRGRPRLAVGRHVDESPWTRVRHRGHQREGLGVRQKLEEQLGLLRDQGRLGRGGASGRSRKQSKNSIYTRCRLTDFDVFRSGSRCHRQKLANHKRSSYHEGEADEQWTGSERLQTGDSVLPEMAGQGWHS